MRQWDEQVLRYDGVPKISPRQQRINRSHRYVWAVCQLIFLVALAWYAVGLS